MVRYMKCPRCELNYIDAEKQEYCDVCMREMKGIPIDVDEIDEAEEVPTELCPVCGENMMLAGEKMCEECRKKAEYEQEEPDPEEDDDWREYLDDDSDAELDSEMDEEFGEEFGDADAEEEEEEEEYQGEDEEEDMEYVTGDEIYTLSGDDDDDDDDDEGDDF